MDSDSRWFSVEVGTADYEQMWAVFTAVEAAALEAARQYSHGVSVFAIAGHSTGAVSRESITETKAAMARNGFSPEYVRLRVNHSNMEFTDKRSQDSFSHRWVEIEKNPKSKSITITVGRGTEVEVNGVFTMLQNAAQAAMKVAPTTDPVPVVTRVDNKVGWRRRQWRKVTTHPMSVQIIGGLVAGVLVIAVAAYFGFS